MQAPQFLNRELGPERLKELARSTLDICLVFSCFWESRHVGRG